MSDTIQERLRRGDSEKLRLLAQWFDRWDARNDVFNSEVQRDLRRIADEIDRLERELAEAYAHEIEEEANDE